MLVIQSLQRFSPDCTLHTAITRIISHLKLQSLTHDYTIGIHMRLHRSNTVIAVCNVQLGVKDHVLK